MNISDDAKYFFSILSLFLLSSFLYYSWSRRLRIGGLKKLGFKVTKKITPPIERLLFNFAPEYMTPETSKTEKIKKKFTRRLLIKWYGYKNLYNYEIHCWSYRLTEHEHSFTETKVVEYWWQAIFINGLVKKKQTPFIRQSRIELGSDIEIIEYPNSLLIIYKRPFFSFKGSLSFLRFLIKKIKLNERDKK